MAEQVLEQRVGNYTTKEDSVPRGYENLFADINLKYNQIEREFKKIKKHYSILPLKTLSNQDKETLSSYKKGLLTLMADSMQMPNISLTSKVNNLYSSVDNFIYKKESKCPYC